jgi:hypothetical protein
MAGIADGCYEMPMVRRAAAPLLLLAPLATGCLHQGDADLEAGLYSPADDSDTQRPVRSDVAVAWAGAERASPPPAVSPRDRPPPDPVPFRIGAGHGALGSVDLAACRELGLQSGYLRMRVTFHPSGHVVHAAVESPVPPSQAALDCVAEMLEEATVPAFDGREASLSRRFFVEPGVAEPAPEDTIVRQGGSVPARRGGMGAAAPVSALARP